MAPKRGDNSSAKDSDVPKEDLAEMPKGPSATEAWANSPFGSISNTTRGKQGGGEIKLPAPTITAAKRKEAPQQSPEAQQAEAKRLAWRESKEKIEEAKLSIGFDSDVLGEIDITMPENDHFLNSSVYFDKEAHDVERDAREKELQDLIERVDQLPERLDFQPGITLIVGENGQGKTTLARAIHFALRAAERSRAPSSTSSYEEVLEDELNPSKSSPRDLALVNQAGLAVDIAPAIKFYDYEQGQPTQQPYFDVPEIIGRRQQVNTEIFLDHRLNNPKRGEDAHRSHRQTVDWELSDLTPWGGGPAAHGLKEGSGIFAIDEVETGLSHGRQLELEDDLLEKIPEGSIVIAPTNSIVLCGSDLPRIDLAHTERGIHRPSEYPDEYQTITLRIPKNNVEDLNN